MLTTELFELNAASHGLVPAYPLWDRRLVEFLLAVPAELRIGGGVTKRLLREGMAGLAPAANMRRPDKLSLAPFFRRGLVHEDRERVVAALTDLHPALARTVPPRRAARVLDDLLGGRDVPMLQLWFLICANLWLRQVAPRPAVRSG
jgi:asparagine synthase (glutamine-hydrolysing)